MSLEDKLASVSSGKAMMIGIILAGVYWALLYDNGESLELQIVSGEGQIQTNNAEIEKLKKAQDDAARYEKLAADMGEKMDRLLQYLPSQLTISELMKLLSNEAKAAGANIVSVNERGGGGAVPTPTELVQQLQVELTLEASYSQILLFLSYLTRINRIVVLSEFSITKTNIDKGANSPLNFKGVFAGYKYVAPVPPAGTELIPPPPPGDD